MTLRRWSVAAAVLIAGCGAAAADARGPATRPAPAAAGGRQSGTTTLGGPLSDVVAVGRPVAPLPVRDAPGEPGTTELRATAPGGGPEWFAGVVTPPRGRPNDVCVITGLVVRRREANVSCDVAVEDAATSFVAAYGVPDRYGAPPTVVSGVASPTVRAVRLEGPGGRFTLPLSAHRAFLAVYAAGLRGRVRVASVRADGVSMRSVRLGVPLRLSLRPHHVHRRPGAVFNDEIGENIVRLTYRQVVRRFGPPAVRTGRCAYYELVGWKDRGWMFCFRPDGRMRSASGNAHRPAS
jgi:hypothetical protein